MRLQKEKKRMVVEPVKFLNKQDLANLDVYEYHGGDYSFIDNLLNPFWYKVAYSFPTWFAPNLITLTGLVINIIAAMLIALHDPMMLGEAPGWIYINAAICLQIYAIFDAADGKQARRLNASSPLGQIFDHGCDAVNLIFIIVSSISGVGLGMGKTTVCIIVTMCTAFVAAQLVEFETNILVAGSKLFGVTEAMLVVSALLVLTGIFGVGIWSVDLRGVVPFLKELERPVFMKYIVAIALIVVIALTMIVVSVNAFIKPCPIPVEKRGNKNVDRKSFLVRFIPLM